MKYNIIYPLYYYLLFIQKFQILINIQLHKMCVKILKK